MKNNVALTIAGLDPSGGAGITADIKTFSVFGCYATSVVSSITFQNTQGVFGTVHQSAKSVRKQLEPIIDDFNISAFKTGMLPTEEVIKEVSQIIKERKLKNFVIDPVVRSTSGFDLIDDKALKSLIGTLFPLSDLITPNLPEAERISGIQINSDDKIREAALIMKDLGAKNVLIKGGHESDEGQNTKTELARDFLFINDNEFILEEEFIETDATHGTGCTLAAAITANLALGKELKESVEIAKKFVTMAIKHSPDIGKGNSPVGIDYKLIELV